MKPSICSISGFRDFASSRSSSNRILRGCTSKITANIRTPLLIGDPDLKYGSADGVVERERFGEERRVSPSPHGGAVKPRPLSNLGASSSKVVEGDFAEAEGQVGEDVQARNHLEYREFGHRSQRVRLKRERGRA